MSGSKAPDFDAYGLLRATHSHVSAPLRFVLDMCHWHIAPYPIFAYRGIIIPLLCSYQGGSYGLSPTYEQAHVGLDLLTLASSLYCIQTKEAAYYFSVRNFVLYYSVFTFTISILYHLSRLFDLAFVNFYLTSGVLPPHIRHPVESRDIPAGFRIKSGTFHLHPDSPCSNSIHSLRHIHN